MNLFCCRFACLIALNYAKSTLSSYLLSLKQHYVLHGSKQKLMLLRCQRVGPGFSLDRANKSFVSHLVSRFHFVWFRFMLQHHLFETGGVVEIFYCWSRAPTLKLLFLEKEIGLLVGTLLRVRWTTFADLVTSQRIINNDISNSRWHLGPLMVTTPPVPTPHWPFPWCWKSHDLHEEKW